MEQGALKIRVRSLENERALERMALTQASTSALLVASVLLQLGLSPAVGRVPSLLAYGGAALSADERAAYGATVQQAAASLASRYSDVVQMTRSWGQKTDDKQFEVIIDNLMNLELLFWAAEHAPTPTTTRKTTWYW